MKKTHFFFLVALTSATLCNAQIRIDSISRVHVGDWPYGESQMLPKAEHTIYGSDKLGALNLYLPNLKEQLPIDPTYNYMSTGPYFIQCVRGTENSKTDGKVSYWNNRCYVRTFFVSHEGYVYAERGVLEEGAPLPPAPIEGGSGLTRPASSVPDESNALSKLSGIASVEYTETNNTDAANDISTFSANSSAETKNRIGLPANLVETAIPQAVRDMGNGAKGIYYSDIVAVLVDAVNELNTELEAVKAQLASSQPMKVRSQSNAPTETAGTEAADGMEPGAFLAQNNPNPFNTETVIAYRLPDGTTCGSLRVYDLQGKQVRKFDLDGTAGEVTIQASELEAGMYLYTLLADGNEVGTRRMILTD